MERWNDLELARQSFSIDVYDSLNESCWFVSQILEGIIQALQCITVREQGGDVQSVSRKQSHCRERTISKSMSITDVSVRNCKAFPVPRLHVNGTTSCLVVSEDRYNRVFRRKPRCKIKPTLASCSFHD
jgi:hypothetical protein